MDKKNKKVVKRRKIKKRTILISLLFVIVLSLSIYCLFQIKISNIYIIGNEILTDKEIIEIAKLDNYPKTMDNSSSMIKKRLEDNNYIKHVKVEKKHLFKEVYIYIEEDKPLFYYQMINKTILMDGDEVDDIYDVPVVTNEIDSSLYQEFLESMSNVDRDILIRISEIKYDPNDIDMMRFYLTMNDGNYVYLTLNKFEKINNYLDIVKSFNNTKGILYLDSGEYFEIR